MFKLSLLLLAVPAAVLGAPDRSPPSYHPRPSYPKPEYLPTNSYPAASAPSYAPPEPKFKTVYEEVCKLKEWSSDTELCKPDLVSACEQEAVSVYKIKKPEPKCITLKVPVCKTTDAAEDVEICKLRVDTEPATVTAEMVEQKMTKRCDTHYTTECRPAYGAPAGGYGGGYAQEQCVQVPTQNCYDVPVLKPVDVNINVRKTNVDTSCSRELLPTPSTICWEEEKEFCTTVPELKRKDEHISKCSVTLSDDKCERVRLTIPREICTYVQKYQPVYGPPGYPAKAAKQ